MLRDLGNVSPNRRMLKEDSVPMHRSFFWGKDVVLLFAGFPGSGGVGMYVLALAVVFLMATGTEILAVAPSWKPRSVGPAADALIHALVFGIRVAFVYLIMLSVMSLNLGVLLAAVAGHVVGCFILKYRALAAATAAAARDVDCAPKV